jgi:hypothetical protein
MTPEQVVETLNGRFDGIGAHTPRPMRVWTEFLEPKRFEEALLFVKNELGFHKGKHIVGTDEGENIGLCYIVRDDENPCLCCAKSCPRRTPPCVRRASCSLP